MSTSPINTSTLLHPSIPHIILHPTNPKTTVCIYPKYIQPALRKVPTRKWTRTRTEKDSNQHSQKQQYQSLTTEKQPSNNSEQKKKAYQKTRTHNPIKPAKKHPRKKKTPPKNKQRQYSVSKSQKPKT
ncbi:hypothetical protein EX30DRAFT_207979 [Ascodesmis nigricans]|uniref:Uncharacterized protein n=1 Tax=Ascodesmis nigricans TaxID=341454 RepID=A0A4S2MJM2_9PEZI|nr:hypothetical protein EX30DRAFT_207979 [Ascodesmis nigricans]